MPINHFHHVDKSTEETKILKNKIQLPVVGTYLFMFSIQWIDWIDWIEWTFRCNHKEIRIKNNKLRSFEKCCAQPGICIKINFTMIV